MNTSITVNNNVVHIKASRSQAFMLVGSKWEEGTFAWDDCDRPTVVFAMGRTMITVYLDYSTAMDAELEVVVRDAAEVFDIEYFIEVIQADAARMTHLRDEKQALESAIVNTHEGIMDDLRLVMAALKRPEPKVEVAMHRVELVMDAINNLRNRVGK